MKIIVVGGGISGLATAHAVRERAANFGLSLDLTVLEASERLSKADSVVKPDPTDFSTPSHTR